MFWLICFVYLIDQMKFQNAAKILDVKSYRTSILAFAFEIVWFLYMTLK